MDANSLSSSAIFALCVESSASHSSARLVAASDSAFCALSSSAKRARSFLSVCLDRSRLRDASRRRSLLHLSLRVLCGDGRGCQAGGHVGTSGSEGTPSQGKLVWRNKTDLSSALAALTSLAPARCLASSHSDLQRLASSLASRSWCCSSVTAARCWSDWTWSSASCCKRCSTSRRSLSASACCCCRANAFAWELAASCKCI